MEACKSLEQRGVPFPGSEAPNGQKKGLISAGPEATPEGHDGVLVPVLGWPKHACVDAPMHHLTGPRRRRAVPFDEFVSAEGRDGHADALVHRRLFVACVVPRGQEDGEVVWIGDGGGLLHSTRHQQSVPFTNP